MANISSLIVKLEAQTAKFKSDIAGARDRAKKAFDDIGKSSDRVSDGLTDAARAAGIYRDANGKLREEIGRFVSAERMAEFGIKNWNRSAKEGTDQAGKFKDSINNLSEKLSSIGGIGGIAISGISKTISFAISAIKTTAIAGAGAATAFVTAFSFKANQAREIDKFSRALGVNVIELQKWNFAASKFGVSGEKMADIFKDVSDKIGDFITTGGGEAKEIFEQLGLRAKDFIGLAPDEAFKRIGAAMDGLAQNEKIFFMEALANDASMLLPLLENNAEAFKKLAAEGEKAGAILSEDQIRNATRFSVALGKIKDVVTGFWNQLAGAMSGPMAALAEGLQEWISSLGDVKTAAQTVAGFMLKMVKMAIAGFGSLVTMLGRVVNKFDEIKLAALEAQQFSQSLANTAGAIPQWIGKKAGIIPESSGNIDYARQIEELKEQMKKTGDEFDVSGYTNKIQELLSKMEMSIGDPVDDNSTATKENTRSIKSLNRFMEQQKTVQAEQLKKSLPAGGSTGVVNFDRIIKKQTDVQLKTSSVFERAAASFAKGIESGALTAGGATQSISMLRGIVAKLGLDNATTGGAKFDLEGMQGVIDNLAEMARAQLSGEDKKLTIEDYRTIFEDAARQGVEADNANTDRTIEAINKLPRAIYDAANDSINGKPQEKIGSIDFNLEYNGRKMSTTLQGSPDHLKFLKKFIEQNSKETARAVAR